MLQAQGLGLDTLLRCTAMRADIDAWATFNTVWGEFFAGQPTSAR